MKTTIFWIVVIIVAWLGIFAYSKFGLIGSLGIVVALYVVGQLIIPLLVVWLTSRKKSLGQGMPDSGQSYGEYGPVESVQFAKDKATLIVVPIAFFCACGLVMVAYRSFGLFPSLGIAVVLYLVIGIIFWITPLLVERISLRKSLRKSAESVSRTKTLLAIILCLVTFFFYLVLIGTWLSIATSGWGTELFLRAYLVNALSQGCAAFLAVCVPGYFFKLVRPKTLFVSIAGLYLLYFGFFDLGLVISLMIRETPRWILSEGRLGIPRIWETFMDVVRCAVTVGSAYLGKSFIDGSRHTERMMSPRPSPSVIAPEHGDTKRQVASGTKGNPISILRDIYRQDVVARRVAGKYYDDRVIAEDLQLQAERATRKKILRQTMSFLVAMYDTTVDVSSGRRQLTDEEWVRVIYSRLWVISYKPAFPVGTDLKTFRTLFASACYDALKETVEKTIGKKWDELSFDEQFIRVCMCVLSLQYGQAGAGIDLGGGMAALILKHLYPIFCREVPGVMLDGTFPRELIVIRKDQ